MAARKLRLFALDLQQNPRPQSEKRKPRVPPKRAKRPRPEKFTLAEAFSPFTIVGGEERHDADLERGLRSVAFLLHSLSDIGNEDVEWFCGSRLGLRP